jgi:pyrimidine-nucleoside phosphorylase
MEQPLGRTAGNFVEVREAVDSLRGGGPADLVELTLRLTAHMLVLGGLEADVENAERHCRRRLEDGSAWECFLANVDAQGGDRRCVEDPDRGPRAETVIELPSPGNGFVEGVDAYRIGLAAGLLGASRARKEDPVRPEAGIELLKTQGDAVARGEPLCRLHLGRGGNLEEARTLAEEAYRLGEDQRKPSGRIMEELSSDDLGEN